MCVCVCVSVRVRVCVCVYLIMEKRQSGKYKQHIHQRKTRHELRGCQYTSVCGRLFRYDKMDSRLDTINRQAHKK